MSELTQSLRRLCRENEAALWLTLIVAVAAILRMKGLTFQSYWYDELFSAHISKPTHSFSQVIQLTLADVHPPLYQLAMWASYKWLGYNELAGRIPSLIAGIAAIPCIFALASELFDKRTGLYAAALATPNYYFVYYAQEARSYSLFYLFCVLSFYCFVRAVGRHSWPNVLLFVAVTILLCYMHYFGFVLLIIELCVLLLYLFFIDRETAKNLLVRATVSAVLIALAIAPLVPSIVEHAGISEFWIRQPQAIIAVNYFIDYFNSFWIATAFATLILVALTVGVFRLPGNVDPTWLRFGLAAMLLWVVLGFVLPWVRGLVSQPVITDRNTIMLIPPIVILAAYGLRSIPGVLVQRLAGLGLVVAMLYHLVFFSAYYKTTKKNQFRELSAALAAYEKVLPVYTFNFNDTKYNVYFEQQESPLRAVDAAELDNKLQAGVGEPLFWLADAHFGMFTDDLPDRYALQMVVEYRLRGVGARLYVNPAHATKVPLEPALISGADGNWLAAEPVIWSGEGDQLLIGLNESAQEDTVRRVQVDLLDAFGNTLESHVAEFGDLPPAMQFDPQIPASTPVRLLVHLSKNEAKPSVWIVRQTN